MHEIKNLIKNWVLVVVLQSPTVSQPVSVRAVCAGRQRAVRQHCVACYVRTGAAGAASRAAAGGGGGGGWLWWLSSWSAMTGISWPPHTVTLRHSLLALSANSPARPGHLTTISWESWHTDCGGQRGSFTWYCTAHLAWRALDLTSYQHLTLTHHN